MLWSEMPRVDLNSSAADASAFKAILDGLRSAIELVKDISAASNGNDDQKRLVEEALNKTADATRVAEVEIAKTFGYELCKCDFPPTPMLTVGHIVLGGGPRNVTPVFECPKCGYNSAGPWMFTRTAPKRGVR